MKSLFTVVFLCISCLSVAQDDTATIRSFFDYLNCDQFRMDLPKFNSIQTEDLIKKFAFKKKKAREFRRNQRDRISGWINPKNCFYPDGFFNKPDTSVGIHYKRDSLSFNKFNKTNLRINYQLHSNVNSLNPIYLKVYLLQPNIIELRFFLRGYDQWFSTPKMLFGEEKILRLQIGENKRVKPIFINRIFFN